MDKNLFQLIIRQTGAKVSKVGTESDNHLDQNIQGIVNQIIAALGIVCVVVMLIGGINYMTSAGEPSKVEKGKKTILYGAIGLIICVLSFAIVNWTIDAINRGTSEQSSSQQKSEKKNDK